MDTATALWEYVALVAIAFVIPAALLVTGVPQLIALLGRVSRRNPCSERFRLVQNARFHRYTFRREVLASASVM